MSGMSLNEMQQMLRESARRYFADRYGTAYARRAADDAGGLRQRWKEAADMGWTSLLLSADRGGMGLGASDAWVLAWEAGRQLVTLPLAWNVVLLPTLADSLRGQAQAWLEALIAGQACFGEAAVRAGGVVFATCAWSGQAVLAAVEQGAALRLVRYEPPAQGCVPGLDSTLRVYRGELEPTAVIEMGRAPGQWMLAQARMRLLRAADALGAAAAALDAAAAHARQREQFGRPIGANQAIKHRLADHWMALDDAWLAGEAAAREMDVHGASQAERALLYAELLAAEAAQAAAQFAVQVHGAMGITWECDAHLYLKRVLHQIARMQAGRTRAWMLERLWALAA